MSDPFDGLRSFDPGLDPPDTRVIRARAQRIRRRRSVELSAGIAVVLAASVFTVFVKGPDTAERQGSRAAPAPTPAEQLGEVALGEAGGSASVAGSPLPPGPAGGATVTSPTTGSVVVTAGRTSSAQRLRIELELSDERATPGIPAVFRLRVCNDGSAEVAVSFPTGQRYDFEVASGRTGALVWRWGAGRTFTQATGTERFPPGCRLVGEESWNGTDQSGRPVGPGTYLVTGILTSSEPRRSATKTICSVTC